MTLAVGFVDFLEACGLAVDVDASDGAVLAAVPCCARAFTVKIPLASATIATSAIVPNLGSLKRSSSGESNFSVDHEPIARGTGFRACAYADFGDVRVEPFRQASRRNAASPDRPAAEHGGRPTRIDVPPTCATSQSQRRNSECLGCAPPLAASDVRDSRAVTSPQRKTPRGHIVWPTRG